MTEPTSNPAPTDPAGASAPDDLVSAGDQLADAGALENDSVEAGGEPPYETSAGRSESAGGQTSEP